VRIFKCMVLCDNDMCFPKLPGLFVKRGPTGTSLACRNLTIQFREPANRCYPMLYKNIDIGKPLPFPRRAVAK